MAKCIEISSFFASRPESQSESPATCKLLWGQRSPRGAAFFADAVVFVAAVSVGGDSTRPSLLPSMRRGFVLGARPVLNRATNNQPPHSETLVPVLFFTFTPNTVIYEGQRVDALYGQWLEQQQFKK